MSPEHLAEILGRLERQILTRDNQGEIQVEAVPTPISELPELPQKTIGRKDKVSAGLCYRIDTRRIILPNGRRIEVPIKHAAVLDMLMKKVPGKSAERVSELKYAQVAALFESGKIDEKIDEQKEKLNSRKNSQAQFESIEQDLKTAFKKIREQILADDGFATYRAYEWKRQFQKFLKSHDLEIKSLIKTRNGYGYGLGPGWDSEKMAKGDGEAARF
jgi:hypothetical protein